MRANLVAKAEEWRWSSLRHLIAPDRFDFLHPGPVPRGPSWLDYVNAPQTEADLARLRHSVQRGTPFGSEAWVKETAARLGLEPSLRPPGRPRRQADDQTLPKEGLF